MGVANHLETHECAPPEGGAYYYGGHHGINHGLAVMPLYYGGHNGHTTAVIIRCASLRGG